MRKIALACGAIEVVSIFSYGLSILINGTLVHSTVGSPLVQFIIYTIFAIGISGLIKGLSGHHNWARTPFYMIQIFAIIVGYTLISGDGINVKVLGVLVGAVGITGFVSLLRSPDLS
jgi:hypothetical protein